jgi:hypothetical protein
MSKWLNFGSDVMKNVQLDIHLCSSIIQQWSSLAQILRLCMRQTYVQDATGMRKGDESIWQQT